MRAASFLLDYLIFILAVLALAKLGTAGYFAALIFLFLYRYILTSLFGETIGMKICKLKLKNHDFRKCFKREVYRFASLPFYIGYLYALVDPFGRTLHDIMSGTYIDYTGDLEVTYDIKWYFKLIVNIILIISVLRGIASFALNDIGLIGLKKAYTSDFYFQSFEGDNLTSLSQDELYKKTLGRRYTTIIDIDNKPVIVRISNKLTYTEVYRLNIEKQRLNGEYLYKIKYPLQFICSGSFRDGRDLCGVTPDGRLLFIDFRGNVYGSIRVGIENVLTVDCGDIDMDGKDEAVIMGRNGDVGVYKFQNRHIKTLYSRKLGEDIMPQTIYVNEGITAVGVSGDRSVFYHYKFNKGKFKFFKKEYTNIDKVTMAAKFDNLILISHVYRNNMAFNIGRIQRLEAYYIKGDKLKRKYNLGERQGKRYNYFIRTLEGVYDVDGDGKDEIIIKAVGKEDVMGQGYKIEIYKPNSLFLVINRILTLIK